MSDVAREAGCSQSTVSFVLNDNRSVKISELTRRKVLRIAKKLGYQPQAMRGLANFGRPSTGGTIAFVIDSISTSPEGVVALSGVRQAAQSNIVLVAETGNDRDLEPRTLQMFLDNQVEAIIYACIFTRKIELPEVLRDTRVPVILLNCYTDDQAHPAVVPGEAAGGERATGHLIKGGHRRIGTITGEAFMDAARDRLAGYRTALASADIAFDPELVIKGDWSASAGFRATQRLLSLDNPPTAIFCQNDRMAIGCYEALKEHGLAIPRDMSVVGYDDEEIARHLHPRLTTLVLPHREMGRWAIEYLFQEQTPADGKYPPIKLECPLVERESVGPPRGG